MHFCASNRCKAAGLLATTTAMAALLCGAAAASESSSTSAASGYAGIDFAKDSQSYFAGTVIAFNRDLSQSGFVLMIDGSLAEYSYESGIGTVDGQGTQADTMVGYQWIRSNVSATLAAGIDFQNEKLSPEDPTAKAKGSEFGGRIAGSLSFNNGQGIAIENIASYSTVFESYWWRGRINFDLDRFVVGPEALAYGSESYEAQRLGGFVTVKLDSLKLPLSSFTVAVGHQFVPDDTEEGSSPSQGGGAGTYVTLSTAFSY